MTEAEVGMMSKECRQPLEAGKGKEIDFPLEPPEGISLANKVILAL